MSNNQDDNIETPFGRLIREAKEEAFHARRKLRREQPNPRSETKREVAVALADYHDVLSDYADERALDEPWHERMPVNIDALLNDTVTIPQTVDTRNPDAADDTTVPKVVQLSPRDLLALAQELDAIAKELGFAASAKQPTPHEEASMSDLRGLLRARDQGEALDHLPNDPSDEDATDADAQPERLADGGEQQ